MSSLLTLPVLSCVAVSYCHYYTVDCRILDTTSPCTAVHTAARQAKILVEIPREI